MIREALEYLHSLGTANRFEVAAGDHGVHYFDRQVYPCPLPTKKVAAAVDLSTLRSLARFVVVNIDKLSLERHIITCGPSEVSLVSHLSTHHRDRETVARARYTSPFSLAEWQSVDQFLPALESVCEENDGREQLAQLLSAIDVSSAERRERQGMGFQVKVLHGVSGEGWADVDKPFQLAPFRSFPEAGQEHSPFLLQVRVSERETSKQVSVRLREVDGGAWARRAAERVGQAVERELQAAAKELKVGIMPTVIW